jgi:zinc D-Ala-D-Ala carboxypeptidase
MARSFILFGVFIAFSAVCCSRAIAAPSEEGRKQQVVLSPDMEKLGRVLSSLSSGAKQSVPNGNPTEFLLDLNHVLFAEKEDLLFLCDKQHYLPNGFIPHNLVPLVSNSSYKVGRSDLSLRNFVERQLRIMGAAAQKDGVVLLVSSSYRSYDYQVTVYNRLVKTEGQAAADRESARPGTSQHQLGSVVDFGSIDDSFADTRAGKWLTEHAADYGWSLSFPDGYESVTGYRYECWHYRYIGNDACIFQKKWFSNVQQYMLEFIDAWKKAK